MNEKERLLIRMRDLKTALQLVVEIENRACAIESLMYQGRKDPKRNTMKGEYRFRKLQEDIFWMKECYSHDLNDCKQKLEDREQTFNLPPLPPITKE